MEVDDMIRNWSDIQKAGFVLPCPRCGKNVMKEKLHENALSRRVDIYICDRCGTEEALEDVRYSMSDAVEFFKKPLDEWFVVRKVYGKGVAEKTIDVGFIVDANCKFKLTQDDIDDIMAGALERGVNYWCKKAEVVEEEYLGEYASEQISRGGSLHLYDGDGDNVYLLTREKFLKGMSLLVEKGYDEYNAVSGSKVDTCKIDAIIADKIIQLAIFGEIMYA